MNEIICHICHTRFETWDELARHLLDTKDEQHKRNKSGKLWAKKYLHRNAIRKLKEIGKKDFEPPSKLTPEQLEAKHNAKYELSGQTKVVPVKCPRCKTGSRQALEIEFVNSPDALKIDDYYVKLCESCK
jgi:hypothetical protein